MTRIFTTLCGGLLLLCTAAAAWAAPIDQSRMRRDLDIAENALKNILQYRDPAQDDAYRNRAAQIRSIYIDGYGILFTVRADQRRIRTFNAKSATENDARADSSEVVEKHQKARLAEFLRAYGPTIGQLKPTDHIAILLDDHTPSYDSFSNFAVINEQNLAFIRAKELNAQQKSLEDAAHQLERQAKERNAQQKSPDTVHYSSKGDSVNIRIRTPDAPKSGVFRFKDMHIHLLAAIQVRDIDAYRRGNLTDDAFADRIAFRTLSDDTPGDKKIDIMSGIIDTALGQDGRAPFAPDQTSGIYIPELGAIFFVHIGNSFLWNEKGGPQDYDTVKNTLIETIADYGSTLRNLNPDDYLTVQVDFDRSTRSLRVPASKSTKGYTLAFASDTSSDTPDHLLIRVQKKDLDAYITGKRTLDALKQTMQITQM